MKWGFDLGGTKIEGVVLGKSEQLEVICKERIPTEADQGYEHVLGQMEQLLNRMVDKIGEKPLAIGIGTPGSLDPATGLLKNCNATALNGQPFRADLEKRLGVKVSMANDANCFALAEATLGIVKKEVPEAQVVFGVIMGSGVGGGVVVDGKALVGIHGIAGEWGHNFLDESGGACYCGKVGCVETILSGKALERYHLQQYGVDKKLPVIYQEYLEGKSPESKAVIDRLITYFGKAIANIINILDPDAIVLGGGVGNIDLLYTAGVEATKAHVFNDEMRTKILKPELGDSAGVYGAAMLV